MNTRFQSDRKWNQRGTEPAAPSGGTDEMFRLLFERSTDPIWLFDPEARVFIDCNAAAVDLMRAGTKERLMQTTPVDLAPPVQADGRSSVEVADEVAARVQEHGGWRFDWLGRRMDGTVVPVEVTVTPIAAAGRRIHVVISRDITERKRTEDEIRRLNQSLERRVAERTAELSASEARLRTLVEHAPEAIVVFDGDTTRFVSVNENACRLYGLSREALTRVTPAEVSPEFQPDGRPSAQAAREMIGRALTGETPVFEWLHRHASGREFLCEVRLVRLPGEGENLIRASVFDMTERRRRELVQRALHQISEAVHAARDLPSLYARLHAIIRELMSARNFYISIFDPMTKTLSFDYHVDELSTPPDPIPLNTGLTSYVLRTGKALRVGREMNARKRRVDGAVTFDGYEEIAYVESGVPAAIWIGVPLVAQDRTIGVMAVQDYHNADAFGPEEEEILTFVAGQVAQAIERKRAEQALRESEAKHRALFEGASQGVMLHDGQKILEVNQATLRLLGYDRPEDLLGRNPTEMSPPRQPDGTPSAEAAQRLLAECLRKGSVRFEWLARTARHEDVPIEVLLSRIAMGGRHIIQAVINDISERKKAEAELLKTLAREKELNRLKSNFVSMVSHEFRTPLGVIQSSAEILGEYFDRLAADERLDHLRSIQKNTRRMAELMEEVLVLSRFEAGRMSFEPAAVDLPSLCRRIADELRSATHRRCPIILTTRDVAGDARSDERLLRHIFTNLITNAVKYSPEESPVEFEVSRDGGDAVFVVRDHGIGIPEEDQPWLFRAFQRGRNVGDRPGTGLGLVIVKRCVELHGGRIKVDSAVRCGTTVTVRLPIFNPAPRPPAGAESRPEEDDR